jgi:putative membrane protein
MNHYLILFLKGMAMGVANVIPGVSGGTIALITKIYEELINSLKSFDKSALSFLKKKQISKFIKHTNLYFLLAVFGGSIVSVFSIASLFEYLFQNFPVLIWAFFFGLIIASVLFVGKRIKKWDLGCIISISTGTLIAFSLGFLNNGVANDNLLFVFICGVIGISGMMLPGLSGSFILILMGNYELLMVKSIVDFNVTLLGVFCIGSVIGLMSFSHLLSWVFKYYKDITLAALTGFILGSLSITWPWQIASEKIIDSIKKTVEYKKYIPNEINQENIFALLLIIIGFFTVYFIEKLDSKKVG